MAGCSSSGPYRLPFMPAPDIYAQEIVDPFADFDPIEIADGDAGILYVTDRERVEDSAQGATYSSKRGYVLRAGIAQVEVGSGEYTWDEARRISLLKNRTDEFPIQVISVEEFGVLPESISPLQDAEDFGANDNATQELVKRVQAQLDRSRLKDITLYVHGYKVVFENPILVSAELWHYLGYEGSFIAYSWPATPKRTAYFGDSANATFSGAFLRHLLTTLADQTTVERINIIGYSAGTRVVVAALDQLNLLSMYLDPAVSARYVKLGHVILVGADADRDNFARMLGEDLLRIVDSLSIYVSDADKALGLSRWLLAGQNRLGQNLDSGDVRESGKRFISQNPKLRLINVTDAEDAQASNGHGYFRQSPWVSGDILMTLRYGLTPAQRGLVLGTSLPVWEFPPDYLARMRIALTLERGLATALQH